ncbi:DNA cytosine methyltransferase [Streptomyces ovatisporus]|uniref:Cytosine-specific methyltransferase n=1 Tax=Streptomyces ovatisporus TaxID=1128682 RepID=A0ABV9AB63_9ACTN
MSDAERTFTSVEICAGAGGQAVGLHNAGFRHSALIEVDAHAVATLKKNVNNNDEWAGCRVLDRDLTQFSWTELGLQEGELDLLAGGVPCPPFSAAGKQLGQDDERDLFPVMLDLVDDLQPRAVMIENVRGLLEPSQKFHHYREHVIKPRLRAAGYEICMWKVLEAGDYGVPQLRPRAILVAMRPKYAKYWHWPDASPLPQVTVAEALADSMRARFGSTSKGKAAFKRWYEKAQTGIAPTLVGGSKKHGGADLGPSRAKAAWRKLGVDAMGVANEPGDMKDPERDLYGRDKQGNVIGPKLTVSQAAIIQGFPEGWEFTGRKTAAYRQVGNAFPPPVAQAVGERILAALKAGIMEPSRGPEFEHGRIFELPVSSAPLRPKAADRGDDLQRTGVG